MTADHTRAAAPFVRDEKYEAQIAAAHDTYGGAVEGWGGAVNYLWRALTAARHSAAEARAETDGFLCDLSVESLAVAHEIVSDSRQALHDVKQLATLLNLPPDGDVVAAVRGLVETNNALLSSQKDIASALKGERPQDVGDGISAPWPLADAVWELAHKLAAAQQREAGLRALLCKHEFVADTSLRRFCPECESGEPDHEEHCALRAALAGGAEGAAIACAHCGHAEADERMRVVCNQCGEPGKGAEKP